MSQNFAAVIGNFDGIHKGHQYVLGILNDIAHRHDLKTMAITFDTHPREIFDPTFHPAYLTSRKERNDILKSYVDEVKILHFDKAFAAITARDFMEHTLRDEFGVKVLLLGYDNRFGKRNAVENFESYQEYGRELGMKVLLANPIDINGLRVSSSEVRNAVRDGEMEKVMETLGRPYSITGMVVPGHQAGRRIGFPTANILPPAEKILPPHGVYATTVTIHGRALHAMTNIGSRPTFDNGHEVTIESNIFDFTEDIYDDYITVHFLQYIRPEQKFGSVEELKEQMILDREKVMSAFCTSANV